MVSLLFPVFFSNFVSVQKYQFSRLISFGKVSGMSNLVRQRCAATLTRSTMSRGAVAVNWSSRMRRPGFRTQKFRRLAWGDGDPYPYTPRCKLRYLWDDWPTWERFFYFVNYSFWALWLTYYYFCAFHDGHQWPRYEAMRRMRLRREAQELMILEGVEYTENDDRQPDRA